MYHPYQARSSMTRPAPRFSTRNVRGAGWHKRGYRDRGCMWINVRRGSYGHTRGQDVNEYSTIRDLWNDVVRGVQMEDGFPLPEGWTFELSSNKRVIEPSNDLITTIFDGGETVYVKIYDDEDQQRTFDIGTYTWVYFQPGRRNNNYYY